MGDDANVARELGIKLIALELKMIFNRGKEKTKQK